MPPFDDPLVVAGQGTVGMEVVRQLPSVEYVFVPVGGGGLIAGIAAYIKSIRPDVKVVGVEPEGANAMLQSLFHGKICRLNKVDGFADGVAVRQVGDVCFDLCQQLVDGVMTVKTDEICAAIRTSSRRPDPSSSPRARWRSRGPSCTGRCTGSRVTWWPSRRARI